MPETPTRQTHAHAPAGSGNRPLKIWGKIEDFWTRVTDGLEIEQLWAQFKADARVGYRLYSREVPVKADENAPKGRRVAEVLRALFWAILMKLSPARRVMLLAALVLLVLPNIVFRHGDQSLNFGPARVYGELLLIALLLLEIGDRVIMKRDLQIAREIQLWLVPAAAPPVPGLEIAFVNRPANTIAGDYYDVLPWFAPAGNPPAGSAGAQSVPDGKQPEVDGGLAAAQPPRYLLAVADVAGKSLPAALLMATFQASLRSLCTTTHSLSELVWALNQYVCSNSRGGTRFTTAFLAVYDPVTRQLTSINAGHNTPMLRRRDGTVERLEKGGLPFGIQADARYDSDTRTLSSGDRLLIFTDGLTEAVNERDEEFGEGPVFGWLSAPGGDTAHEMLQGLMRQLAAFTGATHQNDDITCLLVRVC